ncbi:MAG: hypothetical protein Q9181_006768, partial [Wetmoreana brouardii]
MTELLATVYAWKTLTYYDSWVNLKSRPEVQTSDYLNVSTGIRSQGEFRRLRRTAARQLFATRRRFFSEGLSDNFEDIIKAMKVEHLWSDIREADVFGSISLREQLASYQPLKPEEERKDRLTRLNEWLLHHFVANDWHITLYNSIYDLNISSKDWPPLWVSKLQSNRARMMMKFWFLDSAAILHEEVASSISSELDSDAIFRPFEDDEAITPSMEY